MGKKGTLFLGIITFVVVLAGGFSLIYFNVFHTPDVVQIHRSLQILKKGSVKLNRLWSEGVIDGSEKEMARSCAKMMGVPLRVDDEYLRCNPHFIDCLIGKMGFIRVRHNGAERKVLVRKFSRSPGSHFHSIVTRSNTGGVEIPRYAMKVLLYLDGLENYSLPVLLSDVCHDTYLPKRIYAYGSSEWRWDNFNRDIFIDKHLVSFRDIFEWMEFDHGVSQEQKSKIQKLIPKASELWPRPVHGLTKEQMIRYCAFRGKQLIDAHVFDAATFMPADKGNPRPFTVAQAPFPWSLKRKKSFLYEAQHSPEFSFKKNYCQKVFTKECLAFGPYKAFGAYSTSWAGIFSVLGGYMELMANPIHPLKNLKLSSFYFNAKSSLHRLGIRALWDGQSINGSDDENVNKEVEALKDQGQPLKIGFRCMRFESGE